MERMVALSEERIERLEREIERRGEAEERLHRIVAGLTQTAAQLSVRVPELEAPRMPPIKPGPAEPANPKRAGPDREDPERAQPEKVEPERPLTAEPMEPTPSQPSAQDQEGAQRPDERSWWRRMFGA